MTYDTRESSEYEGAPVELYEFRRGVDTWRYASSEGAVTLDQQTYQPVAIARDDIDRSHELNRATLKVTTPRDNPVADLFRLTPPGGVVTLTIRRLHRGDTDAIVLWMGRVIQVDWAGIQAQLQCEPVFTSLRRAGLRRHYSRQCQHVLYGAGCRVVRELYAVESTVTQVTGPVVEIPGAGGRDPGYWLGGYILWQPATAAQETRMIVGHDDAILTMHAAAADLAAGTAVTIYPGCNRTMADCRDKFANLDNYGGFPYVPGQTPFAGNILYR